MTALFLYDDARARRFEPFALTRPASELRAGAVLIRHRWAAVVGAPAAGLRVAPHRADFEERDAPPAARGESPAGSVVANARCVVALGGAPADIESWICDGRVAAVRLARAMPAGAFADGKLELESLVGAGGESATIGGWWLDEVWHLVRDLPQQLSADVAAIGPRLTTVRPENVAIIGDHPVYIEEGATIEPLVVFDVTAGPVLVIRGATVQAFTRLVGPCFVGEGSIVAGDRVAVCSIGDVCKVRGEVSNTIFLGHANKGHEGFVGHSYLGRWTNLGAGTITSNLKNTYGPVQLWTPEGFRDTRLQFLGALVGDHAKTGIGTTLTTGSVIGAGANVFGGAMAPKVVAPFAWGDGRPGGGYQLGKFLEVAERVMARRHVTLGDGARRQLRASYEARWGAETSA